MQVHAFTFNPVYENTYVLADETGACVIVDPGCYSASEQAALKNFIAQHGLKPERLLNTHCHLDHVFGNAWVAETWNLGLEIHRDDLPVLNAFNDSCARFGLRGGYQPEPMAWLEEGVDVTFGNTTLQVFFTPGHSPGSVSFYHAPSLQLISGDVLFQGSIGRTDLPGGDFPTLEKSIHEKLFILPDAVRVYSGHGEPTTIGFEKKHNPFVGLG
jgi:hydroxyacylglutathione hydrolase